MKKLLAREVLELENTNDIGENPGIENTNISKTSSKYSDIDGLILNKAITYTQKNTPIIKKFLSKTCRSL